MSFSPFRLSSTNYKLGITNPTPLKNNLVLEICKEEVAISLVCNLCFSFHVVLIPNDFFLSFITQIRRWLGKHGYVYPPHCVWLKMSLKHREVWVRKSMVRKYSIMGSGSWFIWRSSLVLEDLSWCLSFLDEVDYLVSPSELGSCGWDIFVGDM
jgi:hypothetical protein